MPNLWTRRCCTMTARIHRCCHASYGSLGPRRCPKRRDVTAHESTLKVRPRLAVHRVQAGPGSYSVERRRRNCEGQDRRSRRAGPNHAPTWCLRVIAPRLRPVPRRRMERRRERKQDRWRDERHEVSLIGKVWWRRGRKKDRNDMLSVGQDERGSCPTWVMMSVGQTQRE